MGAVLSALLLSNPAMAADPCAGTAKTKLPAADSAGPAAPGCDGAALYYGIGRKPDVRAARACALHAPADSDDVMEMAFGGPALLAMIYANGDGVPRNDDLAIAYACKAGGAPAEIEGRVAHLRKRKGEAAAPGSRFDMCDDVTSGLMEGACQERDSRLAKVQRNATLAALTGKLEASAKTAYAALRKAQQAYVSAVGDNEVDQSGTARTALVIGAEDEEEKKFVETLTRVLSGTSMPAAAPGALAKADAALNAAYRKAQGQPDAEAQGSVTKDGIKATEKLWLAYRDMFVAFSKAAAPGVAPDALAALLSGQRTANLKGLVGDDAP